MEPLHHSENSCGQGQGFEGKRQEVKFCHAVPGIHAPVCERPHRPHDKPFHQMPPQAHSTLIDCLQARCFCKARASKQNLTRSLASASMAMTWLVEWRQHANKMQVTIKSEIGPVRSTTETRRSCEW